MIVEPVSLNISTPTEPIMPGRGFYQLEEDSLFVQVGSFTNRRRFYSYLESDSILLDFDQHGHLIFVEVGVPRKRWDVKPSLMPPQIVEPADIRWLNFRNSLNKPILLANESKTALKLSFRDTDNPLNFYLAQSVIVQTDPEYRLSALWIIDIADDLAGREISKFRKDLRAKQSYFT